MRHLTKRLARHECQAGGLRKELKASKRRQNPLSKKAEEKTSRKRRADDVSFWI